MARSVTVADSTTFAPFMLTTPGRAPLLQQTLRELQQTDWVTPVHVHQDLTVAQPREDHIVAAARELLQQAADYSTKFIMFLEDDLQFNRHLAHNLSTWPPLRNVRSTDFFLASLYDPGVKAIAYHHADDCFLADARCAYGSQALVLSVPSARDIVEHWDEEAGFHDFRILRLAARRCPIHYHVPPLVQHAGSPNGVSRVIHCVQEFNPHWVRGAVA